MGLKTSANNVLNGAPGTAYDGGYTALAGNEIRGTKRRQPAGLRGGCGGIILRLTRTEERSSIPPAFQYAGLWFPDRAVLGLPESATAGRLRKTKNTRAANYARGSRG